MRVVLDTNVIVSGLAYPGSQPGKIVSAWRSAAFEVVLSPYILDELARVLPKLNHRLALSSTEITDLVDSLAMLADIAEPPTAVDATVRDPADQPVLALLLSSQAAYLVSGDKDLLALADRFAIATPAQFCARHGL